MKITNNDLANKGLKKGTNTEQENESAKNSRRRAVQNLLMGTGAVTVGSQLAPENWLKPAVNAVILPSHAQTSAVMNTNASISGVVGTGPTASVLDYFISTSYAGEEIEVSSLSGSCISFEVIDGIVECIISLAGGEVLNGQTPFTGSDLEFSADGSGLTATVNATFDAENPPTSASGNVSLEGSSEDFSAQEGAVCDPILTTTTMVPDSTLSPG